MTLADQSDRDAIARELHVTMLVEAAAGTGKTSSLVTRIAALVASGVDIAHVAAITFTVKAAAQLRERVQEALESAAKEASDVGRERLTRALDSLDRAFIGTTHAFCARLLRERPVEAGLDPEFEELDDVTAALLTEEFWGRWYDAQAATGSEALARVIDAGVRPNLLRAAFLRLVDYADVEMVATPCDRPDLRPAVDRVLDFVKTCETFLPTDDLRVKPDAFEKMMRELVRKRDSSDLEEPLAQLAFLEVGDHLSRKATQKNWADGKQAKRFCEDYAALAASIVRPTVRRWREYVHCLVIEFLRPAVRAFEEARLRDGTLTFNDLLLRARDLLRDHPAVRLYFQRRFTHVLVDEFQDTDPIQAEVLFYLTGEDVEEREWRRLRPRAGSLFIVGDPKQSIYRFRRADITTYLTVKELIDKAQGRVVPLRTNFRSPASICNFVNETFSTLFHKADVDARRQAEHVDLVAGADEMPGAGVFVLETQAGTLDVVADAEARTIARWIRRAIASGEYDAGDFLLVSHVKKRLQVYARALEREGIRYEITGGEAFAESRELQFILPLLRAAADPDDPVAVAAFLRGPLCGASDDALYRFVKMKGRFAGGRSVDGAPTEVAAGLELLQNAVRMARTMPPAAAIAAIFENAGIVTTAAAGEQGGTRAGNVMLALALARRDSAAGSGFGEIVAALDEIVGTKASIEELDIDPSARDVVRLMNLHQVKGLEAPVVFLVDPIEERDREPEIYVDRSGPESRGYLAIREHGKHWSRDIALPQGWDTLAATEKEFDRAERNRRLYVAATRARRILVAGVTLKNGVRSGIWSSIARNAPNFLAQAGAENNEQTVVDAPDLEAVRGDIAARLSASREPSYSVLPITKLAHDTHVQLVRAEEGLGRGTSWGRVLHRMFEELVRNESVDVRAFAENLLKDEERDPVEVDEVVTVVDAVRRSELWTRMRDADERYVEVPFALMVPRAEVGLDGEGETLLHGVVDLVFREGATWHVVDYKTDHTAGRLDSLVAYYRPQVEHYARFWSRLTGAETDAALFFVDRCALVAC